MSALWRAIVLVQPGRRLGDLGAAIEQHAVAAGFSVVREFVGHGLGREFHCQPQVEHFGPAGRGVQLQQGMCFTIEPMINAGGADTRTLTDDWTVVTTDGSLSAQWEHSIMVTEDGYEVLTLGQNENSLP